MGHTKKKETNNIDTSRRINLFSKPRIVVMFNLGFLSLSKFAFKCSCTLIALVFGRGAVMKPSGGFPLQYCPLIA